MATQSLTARWVFPVDQPPLPGGVVTIVDDKIVAVEHHGTRTADLDLGDAAILPGLVNAHTHLDLTGLRGQCPPTPDFTQWLRGVIAHRRQQTPEQIAVDIQTGINESTAAGTTLVGDIAAGGASWDALTASPMRALVFYELLGLSQERAKQAEEAGERWLFSGPKVTNCRRSLSPHAPYSVRKALIGKASLLTDCNFVPLAMHLAETHEELQLLAQRDGPFVAFLQELGVWDETDLAYSSREVLHTFLKTSWPPVIAHGNYLAFDDALPNASIVYCPRTHAAFGHEPHAFQTLIARGVRVALGTDSLASNPDLDMLAEMRFVHLKYPDFPGDALLRMGTLSGAEALGWADETGSLTPGKSADLVVVPLPNETTAPHQLLFGTSERVARTLFRGHWIVGA